MIVISHNEMYLCTCHNSVWGNVPSGYHLFLLLYLNYVHGQLHDPAASPVGKDYGSLQRKAWTGRGRLEPSP
jgi:hypothetical protein